MAVPKKKTTKAKRDQRRAHWKVTMPEISICPNCQVEVRPYHVCTACGMYQGRQILKKQPVVTN
jgi:large subunit ribosomal protein L32